MVLVGKLGGAEELAAMAADAAVDAAVAPPACRIQAVGEAEAEHLRQCGICDVCLDCPLVNSSNRCHHHRYDRPTCTR